MSELLGRFIGYLLIGTMAFVFSYFSVSFLVWNLDVAQWTEGNRALCGAWTMILIALYIFESKRSEK